jgi:hypothetical protein
MKIMQYHPHVAFTASRIVGILAFLKTSEKGRSTSQAHDLLKLRYLDMAVARELNNAA